MLTAKTWGADEVTKSGTSAFIWNRITEQDLDFSPDFERDPVPEHRQEYRGSVDHEDLEDFRELQVAGQFWAFMVERKLQFYGIEMEKIILAREEDEANGFLCGTNNVVR